MPARCQKAWGTGSTQHQSTLMHRVRIIVYVMCNNLFYPWDCNREPCLTMSICFRRINHMAVKIHLHSSSGVREVVSDTVPKGLIPHRYLFRGVQTWKKNIQRGISSTNLFRGVWYPAYICWEGPDTYTAEICFREVPNPAKFQTCFQFSPLKVHLHELC